MGLPFLQTCARAAAGGAGNRRRQQAAAGCEQTSCALIASVSRPLLFATPTHTVFETSLPADAPSGAAVSSLGGMGPSLRLLLRAGLLVFHILRGEQAATQHSAGPPTAFREHLPAWRTPVCCHPTAPAAACSCFRKMRCGRARLHQVRGWQVSVLPPVGPVHQRPAGGGSPVAQPAACQPASSSRGRKLSLHLSGQLSRCLRGNAFLVCIAPTMSRCCRCRCRP